MFDSTFIMKDAGLVSGSGAALVGGSAKIASIGTGRVDARLVVDVTALEIASNDEAYAIAVQGSDTADFSTGSPKIEELAVLNLGAAEVIGGNQDSTTGRYELPFSNVKGGVAYPYVRVFTTVAGAVATGINFTARIEP
ncbi:hypothetical protein NNJEOMEG_00041 [Fundidesulfovibrio magnetotacticus]|uniref:Uncharacterized protein n=1 Tax=Fundidesulfovibrio magnetotacticus TaxID=2730080 RepID=A0A6V8LQ27_9BACT|nr:hypothetical protein [Fundidesulfovibrio magnetotacticus]GFK92219.1 hypothetical protein NNJEOMEG_00041 [Fundidesulfovibrio magnetotacticus]